MLEICIYTERSSARDMYLYGEEQCLRHILVWRGVVLETYIYIERRSARDVYLYGEEQCSRCIFIQTGAVLDIYISIEREEHCSRHISI